jgi:hypothetical protein
MVRIDAKIDVIAAKTGVTASLMKTLVYNESRYNPKAKGDGHYVCTAMQTTNYGKITPSYGLAQISTCWHPEVSILQSTNEDFALNFMAHLLLKGECKQWTTCRKPAQGG